MLKKVTISIDAERCKGCGYCILVCPKNVIRMSREFNKKGFHYASITNVDTCSGCSSCALICPDIAIETDTRERSDRRDPEDD